MGTWGADTAWLLLVVYSAAKAPRSSDLGPRQVLAPTLPPQKEFTTNIIVPGSFILSSKLFFSCALCRERGILFALSDFATQTLSAL